MAEIASSPEKPIDPIPQKPGPDNPISQPDPSSSAAPPSNPTPNLPQIAPPSIAPTGPLLQLPPSFRPPAPPVPLPLPPQFSPVQPPGVPPVPGSGTGSGPVPGGLVYAQLPNQRPPYMPMPNGYLPLPPPGIPRYPSVYPVMARPVFPPRPLGIVGTNLTLARPPVPGVRGPPIIPPAIRPGGIPSVTPTEKPQTTVYVGKIASTVDNDFILSVLQLCGPVKSWKRPQDPTSGTLKGYGFCEFDSAEGILRAIRLLSKLNIDGQELMLNFNSATKEYLERYVQKKRENAKSSEKVGAEGGQVTEKEERNGTGSEKGVPPESTQEESKDDNITDQKDQDVTKFGLVTDEDKEADRGALEKLNGMIEERLKTHPLPPPPPSVDTTVFDTSTPEGHVGLKEGDMDVDIMKNDAADDKNEDDMRSANRTPSEHDKQDTSSPHRSRKSDRSRDRERDAKREREKELERNELEREQERAKRDRERQYKTREEERRYRLRLDDWELREKQKDQMRRLEREKEEERADDRKYDIIDQEHESYDDYNKKRKHRSSGEERKRRLREKEEDLADRLKEEEEIAEAKMREEEVLKKQKQEQEDAMRLLSASATKKTEEAVDEVAAECKEVIGRSPNNDMGHENRTTDRIQQNGTGDEICTNSIGAVDTQLSSNVQSRKLGFGLVASGKRTTVPSVFNEEDEDAQKEKKMRPLIPIDYSHEELQAVQRGPSGSLSPDLAAAAEFAKRITGVNSKEEKPEAEKDRSRRSHEKSSHRGQEWNAHGGNRTRDDYRKDTVDHDKDQERQSDKVKTQENRKLLDAKQLIDTIPKTKDELFSYKINWAIYDKNQLHERMRPWISKKITEFLGEEETSLVNYIVSTTQEHVNASEVLDRLQTILDDEAEMFVLKMWRMLIFEIKKVETGLAARPKA
ncbi:RNA-binding motif protein 25 isoform X1 [Daucus carota subsp. sativus]|uniref:RNA-binding motif protein 25 isoform X1 n=1 Tax=Daucus carota subsp. sativus TaxID=79200 RepID=UPI0007EF57B9|nr:PREDICTED: RNA-binding protein 25-like isoform X1 [Daucus carota subsp. sativus]